MNEVSRLAALRRYNILDTEPERQFDRIVELLARALQTPKAAIVFLDEDRLWPKAVFGGQRTEKPRHFALFPHARSLPDAFVILDAQGEASLRDHPLVAGEPYLRFYAAVPVRSSDGHTVATIFVADTQPRAEFPAEALASLETAARLVEAELERRLTTCQLEDAVEHFRNLAEVSSEWVWDTDEQHRLINLVSDVPGMKAFGLTRVGRQRWQYPKSNPLRGVWADHIADLEARREFRNFEFEAWTEDGRYRVFRISGRPRLDAAGRFLGYRGTGADITERRAQDLARAVMHRQFETSPDLILATDVSGKYLLVNPSWQDAVGFAPDELIGHNGKRIIHPDDLQAARDAMRKARSGVATQFECRVVGKDGRVVPIFWKGLWSEVDQHHFFVGRDMTEQKARQERQRQSQRLEAMGQLTGGLAHDFNNVLGIMMMKLENALEEMPPDAAGRDRVVGALSAGVRATDLVSRLLTFARRRPLAAQDTSIDKLLDNLSGLIGTAAGRRVAVHLDNADHLPLCRIDRTGLESAILNLAANARDAMAAGGRLDISTRSRTIAPEEVERRPDLRAGQWIEIAVRDTGSGMTPEVQARVFDPFFTTKPEGKGTGLGLAMVHGFVHQSGGFLTLDSRMGEGTTFTLYLPALAAEAPAPVGPPPDAVP